MVLTAADVLPPCLRPLRCRPALGRPPQGDILADVSRVESNWFYATRKSTGKAGLVPSNFVKLHMISLEDTIMM